MIRNPRSSVFSYCKLKNWRQGGPWNKDYSHFCLLQIRLLGTNLSFLPYQRFVQNTQHCTHFTKKPGKPVMDRKTYKCSYEATHQPSFMKIQQGIFDYIDFSFSPSFLR